MSDVQTTPSAPQPATDKAIARLQQVADGNGIAADDIKLINSDESSYIVYGVMTLAPLWEVAEINQKTASKHFVKKLHNVAEVDSLKTASWPSDWLSEAKAELRNLPGEGWGLDQRISLSQHHAVYGADENCHACKGKRTVTCNLCHGRGYRTCDTCHGAGRNPNKKEEPCPTCHGKHEVYCNDCKNGHTTCRPCQGRGIVTRYFVRKFLIDTQFGWQSGQHNEYLPSELKRSIDRAGLAKLANGHAKVKLIGENEGTHGSTARLDYEAELPFGKITVTIAGQKCRALVLGHRAAVLELPFFLDKIVEEHLTADTISDLRLFLDAQKVTARRHPVGALIHHYPTGLSKDIAQRVLVKARASLYVMTRRERWLAMGAFTLLSWGITYGWFAYNWRQSLNMLPLPTIIWDLLLPIALIVLTTFMAGKVEAIKLCKVFQIKKARSQWNRLDLLPVIISIIGFFVLIVLKGPVAPEWYANFKISQQLHALDRQIDPPL